MIGKPVRSITHPLREDLPIYLAAEGPKNVALSAEIADGWIAILQHYFFGAWIRTADYSHKRIVHAERADDLGLGDSRHLDARPFKDLLGNRGRLLL